MKRSFSIFLLVALGLAGAVSVARAQASSEEIDLLYQEFAHPDRDVAEAIKQKDYRFIAIDRACRIVPGMERAWTLRRTYGVKHLRQRLRIFTNLSQNFSFDLRARAYARDYNLILARYLVANRPEP